MSDDDGTHNSHYLSSYLSTALPSLGLDFDTYGPYVFGTITTDPDDDDAATDFDENDTEELDSIIDLLRSSSETHSDDDAVWTTFRSDIIRLTKEHHQQSEQAKSDKLRQVRQNEEDRMAQARLEAEEFERLREEKKAAAASEDDEKKREREALLNRFAYEKEDDGDAAAAGGSGGGGGGGHASGAPVDAAPVSNREAAAQVRQEQSRKAREESAKSRESKQMARHKTKEAQKAKADKKEERRKRATKGERKR